MSEAKKQIALSRSEEKWLDELALSSEFWSSIRAKYGEYDGVTEKQYELLKRDIERNSWKRGAPRIDETPIRNKYTTSAGAPRCAHRGKPWCQAQATIVVGTFGFCAEHETAAKADYAEWERTRDDARTQEQPAQPSGIWGDEVDGGGGEDEPF